MTIPEAFSQGNRGEILEEPFEPVMVFESFPGACTILSGFNAGRISRKKH